MSDLIKSSIGNRGNKTKSKVADLSAEALRIMSILKQPNYVFLTLEEIAAEIDLDAKSLTDTLNVLMQTGFVIRIQEDDNFLWGLTYKGYNSAI